MQAKTEQEWQEVIRKGPETVGKLKARWETLKVTPCNCDGTDHMRSEHAPVVNG